MDIVVKQCIKLPIWSNLLYLGCANEWAKSEQAKSEQAKLEQVKSGQVKSEQAKSEQPKFPQITASSMELFLCVAFLFFVSLLPTIPGVVLAHFL